MANVQKTQRKPFRELTSRERRASIAGTASVLKRMQDVHKELKKKGK